MRKLLFVISVLMFGTSIANENSNNQKVMQDCFDVAITELTMFENEHFELSARDATNFLNQAYADCYCLYESSDMCGFFD